MHQGCLLNPRMPYNDGSPGKEAMSWNEGRLGPGEVLERGAGSWGRAACCGQEEEGYIVGKDEMVGLFATDRLQRKKRGGKGGKVGKKQAAR